VAELGGAEVLATLPQDGGVEDSFSGGGVEPLIGSDQAQIILHVA